MIQGTVTGQVWSTRRVEGVPAGAAGASYSMLRSAALMYQVRSTICRSVCGLYSRT